MRGTINFELEPLLDLEMDFEFLPGIPGRLGADPDFSYPAEGPYYEFTQIRVHHQDQWHQVPDWLFEILNQNHQGELIEAVRDWVDQP
jgi:hypothetical protein